MRRLIVTGLLIISPFSCELRNHLLENPTFTHGRENFVRGSYVEKVDDNGELKYIKVVVISDKREEFEIWDFPEDGLLGNETDKDNLADKVARHPNYEEMTEKVTTSSLSVMSGLLYNAEKRFYR